MAKKTVNEPKPKDEDICDDCRREKESSCSCSCSECEEDYDICEEESDLDFMNFDNSVLYKVNDNLSAPIVIISSEGNTFVGLLVYVDPHMTQCTLHKPLRYVEMGDPKTGRIMAGFQSMYNGLSTPEMVRFNIGSFFLLSSKSKKDISFGEAYSDALTRQSAQEAGIALATSVPGTGIQ